MTPRLRPALTLAAAAAVATMGGCLVSSHHQTRITGAYIANEDLFQIKPGVTTLDEVSKALGPPTSRTKTTDGERWTYRWSKVTEGAGAVFLIFGGHSEKEIVQEIAITASLRQSQ